MTPIAKAHDNDLAAIRAEMASSTVAELAERYCLAYRTVRCWQDQYGQRLKPMPKGPRQPEPSLPIRVAGEALWATQPWGIEA